MEFRELLIISIQNEAEVHFVRNIHKARHAEHHLYTAKKDTAMLQCLKISDLLEFYPLKANIMNGTK